MRLCCGQGDGEKAGDDQLKRRHRDGRGPVGILLTVPRASRGEFHAWPGPAFFRDPVGSKKIRGSNFLDGEKRVCDAIR